jgi:hypothetical protein
VHFPDGTPLDHNGSRVYVYPRDLAANSAAGSADSPAGSTCAPTPLPHAEDNAALVADLSIPDGSTVTAGQPLAKAQAVARTLPPAGSQPWPPARTPGTHTPATAWAGRTEATDQAGNTSAYPDAAATQTLVDPASRPPTPWWNANYARKRGIIVANNISNAELPLYYPVHLRLDAMTTPSAAEMYAASLAPNKCDDLRIVYRDPTALDRYVQSCSASAIDLWFCSQAPLAAAASDGSAHQLYYGNSGPAAPSGNAATVLYPSSDANTVGLWQLEGTPNDASAYGNHGQWMGDGSWTTGKFAQAMSIPGTVVRQGGIRVPGSESLRVWSFTIEAFIKRACADESCSGFIAAQGQSNQVRERWQTRIDGVKLALQVWHVGTRTSEWNRLPADTNWHHVAATFDNNPHMYTFYRDGVQIGQTTGDSFAFVWGDPTTWIGTMFPNTGGEIETLCGAIDGVRLSNVVRTSFTPYVTMATIVNETSAAAGSPILPPVVGAPDLAVDDPAVFLDPAGWTLVGAVVRHQCNLSTQSGFYIDLYDGYRPVGSGDLHNSVRFWGGQPTGGRRRDHADYEPGSIRTDARRARGRGTEDGAHHDVTQPGGLGRRGARGRQIQ